MKELRKTIQLIGIFVFLISISLLMIGVNSQENNNYEVKEDNEGNKIIKVKDKTYIIPRSIDIKEGVGGIVFVNEGEDKKFEFLGNNILLIKGAEVEVTSTSNGQEIDLRGRGEITTEWNHLPKIKNAKLKLDKDNNIIFAEFESTGNEEYEFEFNDKIYSFRTEKGSKVLFDPKEKVIKSDKVIVKINGKEISGEKFSIYLGEKEVVEGENTIIITDDKIEAIGKVKVETDSFSYEGLIDSAKLSVDIRDGVENIKIEGEEDRSKEEGGIAKFSKKYRLGDVSGSGRFLKGEEGIEMIIAREEGLIKPYISSESMGKLHELERDVNGFFILDKSSEIIFGKDVRISINSEFGINFKNGEKSVNILSPSEAHLFLGDDSATVLGIVKNQIETSEGINRQFASISKLYELDREFSFDGDKVLTKLRRFTDSLESFEKTIKVIDNLYEDNLQQDAMKSGFILKHLESVEPDFVMRKMEDGEVIYAPDLNHEKRQKELILTSLKSVGEKLEDNPLIKNLELREISDSLKSYNDKRGDVSPQGALEIYKQTLVNDINYDDLARKYIEDFEPKGVIDTYKGLMHLSEQQVVVGEKGIEYRKFPNLFSTEKLGIARGLANEYAKEGLVSDAIALLNDVEDDFITTSYIIAQSEGNLIVDARGFPQIADQSIEDITRHYLSAGKDSKASALLGIKSQIDSAKATLEQSGFKKLQADVLLRRGEIEKFLDERKGYFELEKDSPIDYVFGGRLSRSIVDSIGGFDKQKESASILTQQNQRYLSGISGIATLRQFEVDSDTINKWVNGELSNSDLNRLAEGLLIKGGDFSVDNSDSHELPSKTLGRDRIVNVGLDKYTLKNDEYEMVLDFLENARKDARVALNSEIYGSDLNKLIGGEEIVSNGVYGAYNNLRVESSLSEENLGEQLRSIGGVFSNNEEVDKILKFVDEGTNPFALAIGATTGGIGGVAYFGGSGLTGAALGVGANTLIDGATGLFLVKGGYDVNNPYLAIGTSVAISFVTGTPRIAYALAKSKALAKQSFINFVKKTDARELSDIGLTRESGKLFDGLGNEIRTGSELSRHINNVESKKFNDFVRLASKQELEELSLRRSGEKITSFSGKKITDMDGLRNHFSQEQLRNGANTRAGELKSIINEYASMNEIIEKHGGSIDLPRSEIKRINEGRYSHEELVRINKAKRTLVDNGFNKDADLLNNPENANAFLFSHYSGDTGGLGPAGINVFTKTRPLLSRGMDPKAISILASSEHRLLGRSSAIDESTIARIKKGEFTPEEVDFVKVGKGVLERRIERLEKDVPELTKYINDPKNKEDFWYQNRKNQLKESENELKMFKGESKIDESLVLAFNSRTRKEGKYNIFDLDSVQQSLEKSGYSRETIRELIKEGISTKVEADLYIDRTGAFGDYFEGAYTKKLFPELITDPNLDGVIVNRVFDRSNSLRGVKAVASETGNGIQVRFFGRQGHNDMVVYLSSDNAYSLGFQFTFNKDGTIKFFDVDSGSINRETRRDSEFISKLIEKTYEAIDPGMRGPIKKIRFAGGSEHVPGGKQSFEELDISLPEGLEPYYAKYVKDEYGREYYEKLPRLILLLIS